MGILTILLLVGIAIFLLWFGKTLLQDLFEEERDTVIDLRSADLRYTSNAKTRPVSAPPLVRKPQWERRKTDRVA